MKDLPVGVMAKVVDSPTLKTNHWRGVIVLVVQKTKDDKYYCIVERTQHRVYLPRENLVRVVRKWVEVIEEVDDDQDSVRTV